MTARAAREVHVALVRLQKAEPHHRRIGVAVGGHREPPSLEQVCRRCPSRETCGDLSTMLAAFESDLLTAAPDNAT